MKTENVVLMNEANESLKGNWGIVMGATVLYSLSLMAPRLIPGLGLLVTLAIAGPLAWGLYTILLEVSRNQPVNFSKLFEGFNHWWLAFKVYIFINLFTFLWTLLFIIPGIIAAYSYSMTFFIIVDNPNLGARQAITMSKQMMFGNKWKLFYLSCRFVGWSILCLFTLGIGFLWLFPYMYVTFAKFYDDLKREENPIPEVEQSQLTTPVPAAESTLMQTSMPAKVEEPIYQVAQTHFPDTESLSILNSEPKVDTELIQVNESETKGL